MKETDSWKVRPITHANNVKKLREKADQLVNIEFSARVLLGALYRQLQVNPVDYMYDCLQTQVQALNPETPEYNLISKYVENTYSGNTDFKKFKRFNLFKIMRKGEGERYEKFQHLENRHLLFHGSSMANFVGILSQGLRIAPPEAPASGYMFGKGVYFADTFSKSAAYSHGGSSANLILLCEVALGKSLKQYS